MPATRQDSRFAATLLAVAALACCLAARRPSRVQPLEALRGGGDD